MSLCWPAASDERPGRSSADPSFSDQPDLLDENGSVLGLIKELIGGPGSSKDKHHQIMEGRGWGPFAYGETGVGDDKVAMESVSGRCQPEASTPLHNAVGSLG